jgi:hypothetical protein
VADKEGMIFVEKPLLVGQILCEKPLKSAIAVALRGQAKATHDAPGIGIDDEDGLLGRV